MSSSKKNNIPPPATPQTFPVIGIGASAGGLQAFKDLLQAIPEDSGMAYVLVQHLAPSHESLLPEILARTTKLPVIEITDDIHLAPNHIYVIPSAKILTAVDGVLKLSGRTEKYRNFCIDIFFRSLGEVHKELAAGVVLSGTGTDGTLGLKAIKEYGGVTIAQDQSAAYHDMPQHAVDAGVVDFILPPQEIPKQLLQISSNYSTVDVLLKETPPAKKGDESSFKQILLLLHQRSGVDFTFYKQNTIHRRLARRMALHKCLKIADYLKFLRSDKPEQAALFQDMLIPVTSFFRDPKTFDALCNEIFPLLFKKSSSPNSSSTRESFHTKERRKQSPYASGLQDAPQAKKPIALLYACTNILVKNYRVCGCSCLLPIFLKWLSKKQEQAFTAQPICCTLVMHG